MADPIVIFSSLELPSDRGDAIYNGGYKLHALWCKLLNQHGHAAYRMNRDGTYQPWLIDPQPCVSYETAAAWVREGRPLRVMTTWIVADLTLNLAPHPYFFDAEIGHSACGAHFQALHRWLPQLAKVGTHSRTQQAWYMATFGIAPSYIQEWSDLDYWTPDESQREPGLVGYMHEGPHTDPHIRFIADRCRQAGVAVQFWQVGGSEREVIDQMRRCDVFLGMNLGKHPLYGEGCPRAANEAQHTGCVLICYNVLGNSEYVTDGYTGYLVKRGDPQAMAERLIGVMRHDEERETVRRRGIDFALHAFSSGEGRYQQIKEFLDL